MADLFARQRQQHRQAAAPLPVRMRPRTLDEFVGQESLVGAGKLFRRMLEADRLSSMLLYGPAGTGKTTLARIIARQSRACFVEVNAAAVGVKELRLILQEAVARLETSGERTLLFVDELHRLAKNQQDVLLCDVENGTVILIGSTTENPSFSVNTPLLSRSQLLRFELLSNEDIKKLLQRALEDPDRGLGAHHARLTDEAAEHLATVADGDARRALAALEIAVLSQADRGAGDEIVVDLEVAAESILQKALPYDATGDEHYNVVSALIKSIRGSDPDAAVYWLARMIEGGEDPRFIARRLVISASEDIGNADPMGLVLATAACDAVSLVGLPECQLALAHAAIYLASAPKSNACAKAIWAAVEDVRKRRTVPVPDALKSTGYAGAKRLGAGVEYRYPHDDKRGILPDQDYGIDRVYYRPTDRGAEAKIRAYLAEARNRIRSDKGAS